MSGMREWLEALRIEYERTVVPDRSRADIFAQSKIVARLQGEGAVIREIERYKLPEVTCLICNSKLSLVGEQIFSKYALVAPLYTGVPREGIIKYLSEDMDQFKFKVIPYLDMPLLKTVKSIINETSDFIAVKEEEWDENHKSIESVQKEIDKTKAKIKRNRSELAKIQKAKEENALVTDKDAENQVEGIETIEGIEKESKDFRKEESLEVKRKKVENATKKLEEGLADLIPKLKELNQNQESLQKELDAAFEEEHRLEPYLDVVERAEQNYEISLREKKKSCYEHISGMSFGVETEFIDMFIKQEFKEDTFRSALQKVDLIQNVMSLLCSEKYSAKALFVISSMIEAGALSVDSSELMGFIDDNPEILCEYLVSNYANDISQFERKSVYKSLFDLAIEIDKSNEEISFGSVWDEIESADVWRYISDTLNNEELLAKFTSGIRGRVLRGFLEYLKDSQINIPSFLQMVAKQREVNSDLIFRMTQTYEQKLAKANREMRRANNRLEMQENANASKVFTAMYEPMEKLEVLTIDIKKYDGEIKKKVIASQLVDCVRRFRNALEDLEVFSLEEFDNWRMQELVEYNSELHRYEDGNAEKSNKVYVKTLGYRYTDEEREEQLEYAKVVPVKEG